MMCHRTGPGGVPPRALRLRLLAMGGSGAALWAPANEDATMGVLFSLVDAFEADINARDADLDALLAQLQDRPTMNMRMFASRDRRFRA